MKVIQGDLLHLAKDGEFDVIIHGCNIYNTMGGGIAAQIKKEFPLAELADKQTLRGDRTKLGTYTKSSTITEKGRVTVVNAYTQGKYWFTRDEKDSGQLPVLADYEAIENVFKQIKKDFSGKRIGYPMIGAGLAGGDWTVISKIINKELEGEDHTLVMWNKKQ